MIFSQICLGNFGVFFYLIITVFSYSLVMIANISVFSFIIKWFWPVSISEFYENVKVNVSINAIILIFSLIMIKSVTIENLINILQKGKKASIVGAIIYLICNGIFIIVKGISAEKTKNYIKIIFLGDNITSNIKSTFLNLFSVMLNLIQCFSIHQHLFKVYNSLKIRKKEVIFINTRKLYFNFSLLILLIGIFGDSLFSITDFTKTVKKKYWLKIIMFIIGSILLFFAIVNTIIAVGTLKTSIHSLFLKIEGTAVNEEQKDSKLYFKNKNKIKIQRNAIKYSYYASGLVVGAIILFLSEFLKIKKKNPLFLLANIGGATFANILSVFLPNLYLIYICRDSLFSLKNLAQKMTVVLSLFIFGICQYLIIIKYI